MSEKEWWPETNSDGELVQTRENPRANRSSTSRVGSVTSVEDSAGG